MSDVAALIADMIRAGVDPEIIGRTAATIASASIAAPAPKTARQERNARYYQKKSSEKRLNSDDQDVSDANSDLLSPEGSSPIPPSPKPLSSIPPSPPKGGSSPAGFDAFWSIYPNRVGKRDAEKAFLKAIKRADLETILTGLRGYVAKTDDRPWCNPATWLNQDRWDDAPAQSPQRHSTAPPFRPPRTVAELAIHRLETGQSRYEPPDKSDRRLGNSHGSGQAEGAGILELVAIAANQRSGTS
ncbi:hypothetical protein [Mesorhizobium sp. Pch-S]|uniref:hypothetical protein n=1 Tax=Mesorhizobium sp. Pch-S TaxID=2082387 RepID=UPI001012BBA8|nr:hypothetical protein [Mesorhizobium sp. Pch-S]